MPILEVQIHRSSREDTEGMENDGFTNKILGQKSKNFSSRKQKVDGKSMKELRKEKVGRQESNYQCTMTQNPLGGGREIFLKEGLHQLRTG